MNRHFSVPIVSSLNDRVLSMKTLISMTVIITWRMFALPGSESI